ncbi:YwmB family TATA-box binding protein [Paenibacillus sp. TRM 82003]|nr:YwmB family TATA-box binding protein [Paenibacillus sp. TRM 82003]
MTGMAKRRFGWRVMGMAMAIAAVCAGTLSGWAELRASANAAEGAPTADVEALERLADGIVEPEERLWVVTVRGREGLERYAGHDADEASRWMEATAERLAGDADYAEPIWSVNLQGMLPADAEVEGVAPHVEALAQAKRVESYEQPNTISYAYESDAFESAIRSGDATINVMAAAHLDTESNRWRVTLGTPAILIEY